MAINRILPKLELVAQVDTGIPTVGLEGEGDRNSRGAGFESSNTARERGRQGCRRVQVLKQKPVVCAGRHEHVTELLVCGKSVNLHIRRRKRSILKVYHGSIWHTTAANQTLIWIFRKGKNGCQPQSRKGQRSQGDFTEGLGEGASTASRVGGVDHNRTRSSHRVLSGSAVLVVRVPFPKYTV